MPRRSRYAVPFAAAVALALCVTGVGVAWAQSFKPPPAPARHATDTAGFVSPGTIRQLDARLQKYERDTGRQVVLWIGRSTGNVSIEEWAARTFEAWDIGRKGKDDGVGIFIFAADRKLRIEVGYGLEGDLPDLTANRIIQEEAVPRLRAGDADGAVVATVGAVLQRIGGEVGAPAQPPSPAQQYGRRAPQREASVFETIVCAIFAVIMLILFITNPRLALLLLMSMGGGGGRGGGGFGGGGGGGFGGGGGRSGGGGASGSW